MKIDRILLFLIVIVVSLSGVVGEQKLVVLTFDDSIKSHYTVVRPILKELGFGATFFITEGWDFKTNKDHYMTWEQIKTLHEDGFEIGNHTRDHMGVNEKSLPRLKEQLEAINQQCLAHGISKPVSFAYPGNRYHIKAFDILEEAGIKYARRGNYPKVPKLNNIGYLYEPGVDHPLLIPSSGISIPSWKLKDLKHALIKTHDKQIPILQFHGVPDTPHPWVNTNKEIFIIFMQYLKEENYKVIALRDLSPLISEGDKIESPMEIIRKREKLSNVK